MTNELLKPMIDEILTDYFNQKTRLNHSSKDQANMVAQNRGLTNACSSVITFSDNMDELAEYTRAKIAEINQGEAQEISFR